MTASTALAAPVGRFAPSRHQGTPAVMAASGAATRMRYIVQSDRCGMTRLRKRSGLTRCRKTTSMAVVANVRDRGTRGRATIP